MQINVDRILEYLNKVETRCTYGAIAQALDINPRQVSRYLQPKRPEASWVVNGTTGLPTGYLPEEVHARLERTDRIIKSGEVLCRVVNI
jgi:hypothetical protein